MDGWTLRPADKTYLHRHEIVMDAVGDRQMTYEIKNINWEGEFETVC
jgi:hypothetical protein